MYIANGPSCEALGSGFEECYYDNFLQTRWCVNKGAGDQCCTEEFCTFLGVSVDYAQHGILTLI